MNNFSPQYSSQIESADSALQDQILQNLPTQMPISKLQAFFQSLKSKAQSFFARFQSNTPQNPTPINRNMGLFAYFLISKNDLVNFLEQLSTLLSSGIRLVDSLVIMKQQAETASMKKLLACIISDIRNGALLSQAMEQHPRLFLVKWISLVRAGEKSGQLEQILLDLAEDEQEQQKMVSALKGAMAYPVFVVILTTVLVMYMLIVVVPEISDIYTKMHQKLPAPTIFIITLSEIIQQTYPLIIGGFLGLIVGIKISSHFFLIFRELLDWINLRIPVFGNLRKKQNIALFAGNLSLLLQSGVLIVDALNIVRDVIPSPLFKNELRRIIGNVERGAKISQEMGLINLQKEEFIKNFYFPINVSQMIHIGEETGNLAKILEKLKKNYSNQIQLTIKTFSSLLEPVMIIIVGLMVGGILLAVILPFFSMKV